MIAFEEQRLPTSKKTRQWRINNVDAIASRTNEFGGDWNRIRQNFMLKNSQLDQEEFREYCDTLGLNKGEGKKFVEPFNMSHTIVEVIKGDEAKMPWTFGVTNLSPKATNELIRMKERDYINYFDEKIAMEIEKQNQKNEIFIQMKTQGLQPEEAEKMIQQLQQEFQEKEQKLLNPEKIEAKYSNYKSKKEKAIHKLLKTLAVHQDLKWMKNATFEDALLGGVEAVEVSVKPYSGMPYLKQLNILNLVYQKSPDTPFIHNSSFAGYKEEMTISDIIDLYGSDLSEKDIKKLRQYNQKVFGTDAKFSDYWGDSPSNWDNLKKYEYTYKHPLSTIPSFGTTNVLSEGLYSSSDDRYRHENYGVVYTTYWRSYRKVGKLSYKDDYNQEQFTIVGEEFPVPERAKKKNYKPHMFSRSKTRWEWEDTTGEKRTLEWIWIPEIWKGTRINGDIYPKIEPYEHAYQSILDPYKTKLPIHGFVYGNRNAFTTSWFDRIKPWQKLYYVIAAKWLKLITQDKGVVQLLNILMMDKKLGYERSLNIAVDQGVLPYNPLAHTQGTGVAHNHRPAERLDLSNSQQLTYYTELLKFVEQQMKSAAGIPESRLAQTGKNTNVTDNQRDVHQSYNITNSLFAGHELLWQEILQSLCETAVKSLDSKSGYIRQVLSDDEIALIDLDLISLEDEYSIKVGNNTRSHQILQEVKQYAQALIQNDKAKFSTLVELMETDNLVEFKEELRGIEYEIEQREIQQQKAQQEHEEKMQQQLLEQQEAERKQRMDEIKLKGEYDILGKQISSMAWDPEKDRDRDGMPDILEIEQFRNQVFNDQEKLNIERTKLAQEDQRIQQAERQAQMKERQESANAQQNLSIEQARNALENRKIKSNEKIEKAKAQQAKANKPNSK